MRTSVDFRSGGREAYDNFRKAHPKIDISFNLWQNIVYSFNEEFRNIILETGDILKMPGGIGWFTINKKKRKQKVELSDGRVFSKLPIDWLKTKQKGKTIYNLNHHTGGYFFGWVWFKEGARFKHSQLWYFKPTRNTSRLIKHYISVDEKYQHIYLPRFK